jgi:threonine/homoserine/homoserine lactone efflux protein
VVPEPSKIALFVVAAATLAAIPGPAVLYVVSQSVAQGRLAGAVSALGIATGGLVQVLAAGLGLSSLLASSATAFSVVKYVGAVYLVYLGVRRLLDKDDEPGQVERPPRSLGRLYRRGVVVNILNPKTALFFLAFLPQFVDPARGSVWLQTTALGLLFVLVALCSDTTYALVSGQAAEVVRHNRGFVRGQRFVTGGVLVGLGVTAALSGSPSRSS